MTWQVLPPEIVEIRNRWRNAPDRLGPFSRHPRSLELLRHARADIVTLLAHLDLTMRDPVADLCHDLAQLGAAEIEIRAIRPQAGERGQYEVTWRPTLAVNGLCAAQGWSPSVALRKAIRLQVKRHNPDSDRLAASEGGAA